MYTVWRWFKVNDEYSSEPIGIFPDETTANQFCVFYAMLHMITVDDLDIGYDEHYSFDKLIDEVICK